MRGNGGRIGPKYTPSIGAASGIWNLNENSDFRRSSLWPLLLMPKFSMAVNSTFTIRPMTFGSYGMSQARWETVFSAISAPWYSSREVGVSLADVVTHYNNPQESARSNPQPSGVFSVTGWPIGVYEFTLHGGGGADADPGFGAPGGLGVGRITLTPADTIYFFIGQGGIYTGGASRSSNVPWYYPNPGGWNGGGAAGAQNSSSMYSGSGGGGTDIRLNGIGLDKRIMIAGGGGGATDQNYMTGGAGGGFNQSGQNGGNAGNSNGAKGGTLSAGGSGALYNGVLYESYMNGSLWSGGRGYDGSQPVSSANAAGGGGGGYYGGGGAVDESGSNASGSGGGSGYADTSIVSVITATVGGAANGNPNWSLSASSVNGSGHSLIDYDGTSFTPSPTSSNDSTYSSYRSDGTKTHINRRYGGNGLISVKRIS